MLKSWEMNVFLSILMWFRVENSRNIPVCCLEAIDLTCELPYIWLWRFIIMFEFAKWSNTLDAFEIDAHLLCYITTVLLITGLICVSLNSWPYVECIHVGNPILLDVPESCYSTWVSYPSSMCILPFSRTSHWTYAPNYVWALKTVLFHLEQAHLWSVPWLTPENKQRTVSTRWMSINLEQIKCITSFRTFDHDYEI